MILDVYSRYVVGWKIAEREPAELVEAFIAETYAKEGIAQEQLTVHAVRGSAMTQLYRTSAQNTNVHRLSTYMISLCR